MIVKIGSKACSPLRTRTIYDFNVREYILDIIFARGEDLEAVIAPDFDGTVSIYLSQETFNTNRPVRVYSGCQLVNAVEEIGETQEYRLTLRAAIRA